MGKKGLRAPDRLEIGLNQDTVPASTASPPTSPNVPSSSKNADLSYRQDTSPSYSLCSEAGAKRVAESFLEHTGNASKVVKRLENLKVNDGTNTEDELPISDDEPSKSVPSIMPKAHAAGS